MTPDTIFQTPYSFQLNDFRILHTFSASSDYSRFVIYYKISSFISTNQHSFLRQMSTETNLASCCYLYEYSKIFWSNRHLFACKSIISVLFLFVFFVSYTTILLERSRADGCYPQYEVRCSARISFRNSVIPVICNWRYVCSFLWKIFICGWPQDL